MPSLTAALIARDDADKLGRCLASVRPFVEEVVVVDTGSTDETIEVARSFDATIGQFDWMDDFAAARNAALALVMTDWFLSLDTDEELVCQRSRTELDEIMVAAPRILLDLEDVHRGGKVKLPRLFENVPGTHWEQPIHETLIQPGVDRSMSVDAEQGVFLRHHGYDPASATRKLERNLRILRRHLAAEPDNPGSLFYLARECAWSGEYQEGFEAGKRLLENELTGVLLSDALGVTAWNALYLQDYATVVDLGRRARRENVPTVWTEYMLSLALFKKGDPTKALEAAERACSLPYPEESMLTLQEIWTRNRFVLRDTIRAARNQG